MLPATHILTWRKKWVVDIGPVLKTHFIEKDPDRTLFGYIPIMATTCKGSIGALLSASFCERVNSCANRIFTAGNTSLGDDLVNKTVVLRMKKNFMKFMNLNYAWILKQRFLLHIWPGIWTLFVICTHEPILLHGHLRSISIEHCLLCVTPSASIFPIGL